MKTFCKTVSLALLLAGPTVLASAQEPLTLQRIEKTLALVQPLGPLPAPGELFLVYESWFSLDGGRCFCGFVDSVYFVKADARGWHFAPTWYGGERDLKPGQVLVSSGRRFEGRREQLQALVGSGGFEARLMKHQFFAGLGGYDEGMNPRLGQVLGASFGYTGPLLGPVLRYEAAVSYLNAAQGFPMAAASVQGQLYLSYLVTPVLTLGLSAGAGLAYLQALGTDPAGGSPGSGWGLALSALPFVFVFDGWRIQSGLRLTFVPNPDNPAAATQVLLAALEVAF